MMKAMTHPMMIGAVISITWTIISWETFVIFAVCASTLLAGLAEQTPKVRYHAPAQTHSRGNMVLVKH